ncbi:hypothetical protein [Fodinicola feengrottensis]|uniref:hypothetical protein n=1 Tax=Fodinicola feengrottensis TaxID=435914 RepID=UPI0013CFFB7F|nr:hypothetical protein [Fodinicola feengrottensis]
MATILDTRTNKVVVRHQVPHRADGWQVEDVFLTDGYAIVVDADAEPPYRPKPWYAVTRYQLSTGTATSVADQPPVSTVDPEVVAGDGRYAYVTDQGGRGCVAVADVRQVAASVRYCAPVGWLPGFLRTGDSSVTFAENSENASQSRQPAGCRRLVRLPSGGAATDVPALAACRQYAGAGVGNWSAWSDASDADADVEHAPVLAAVGRASPFRVDVGVVGSLRTCGDWVYYDHRADPSTVEIRRWRPGHPIEVIYRSPGEELSATTSVACADGWVSFMRQYTGAGSPHTGRVGGAGPRLGQNSKVKGEGKPRAKVDGQGQGRRSRSKAAVASGEGGSRVLPVELQRGGLGTGGCGGPFSPSAPKGSTFPGPAAELGCRAPAWVPRRRARKCAGLRPPTGRPDTSRCW